MTTVIQKVKIPQLIIWSLFLILCLFMSFGIFNETMTFFVSSYSIFIKITSFIIFAVFNMVTGIGLYMLFINEVLR